MQLLSFFAIFALQAAAIPFESNYRNMTSRATASVCDDECNGASLALQEVGQAKACQPDSVFREYFAACKGCIDRYDGGNYGRWANILVC